MSDYLFIQSQDPFTEARTTNQYQLAIDLHDAGHKVTLLLVQNGVTPARAQAQSTHFEKLLSSGVTVAVDDFALQQREIPSDTLKPSITVASLELAVDALLAGHKVIWN